MLLDDEQCFKALTARDRRFDGVFFVGVTTTGIYCRPICPAKTPGRTRCRFHASAAACETAGFRPCLRCRPELAPGSASVDRQERIARRAASHIASGALDDLGVAGLAERLDIGERHLRRVVGTAFGVSPKELAMTHRLLLAKRLLTDTTLPIAEVASASGFGSVRRFQDAFRTRYRLSASALRRRTERVVDDGVLRLSLSYRPPLAWSELLRFLSARCTAGVESITGTCYARVAVVGEHVGVVRVEPRDAGSLSVTLTSSLIGAVPAVLARLRDLFDLDARPDVIATHLSSSDRLAPLIKRMPGLRVPGAYDGFEIALRAVLGQQITVAAATTIAGRFAKAFGLPRTIDDAEGTGLCRSAPTAERLADATPRSLRACGLTHARAHAVRELARAVADGSIDLDDSTDPDTTIARLCEVPGIGPWTAEYIAMRSLRSPDAFPDGDLILRRVTGTTSAPQLRATSESWRPWRAYAAMYLWHSTTRTT